MEQEKNVIKIFESNVLDKLRYNCAAAVKIYQAPVSDHMQTLSSDHSLDLNDIVMNLTYKKTSVRSIGGYMIRPSRR